jgi:hypothetical protein
LRVNRRNAAPKQPLLAQALEKASLSRLPFGGLRIVEKSLMQLPGDVANMKIFEPASARR